MLSKLQILCRILGVAGVIFSPCKTQVELVWSKSEKKTGIKAKTNKMGVTERAAAIST